MVAEIKRKSGGKSVCRDALNDRCGHQNPYEGIPFLSALRPFYGAASRLIDIVEQLGRGYLAQNRSHGPCGGSHSPSWPIWWDLWAKNNIEARTLFDAGQLLKIEQGATMGCGYIGRVGTSVSAEILCEVPMTLDPE
jgi:hypothetical protein